MIGPTARRGGAGSVVGAQARQPSPALAERLGPAAALYQQGRVHHIILTGAVDSGGTISEAEAGARYLQRRFGLSRDALALDETSTSTASNLGNALAIMEKRGWQTAVVITHGYHLHRAMLIAHDVGLPAMPYGTESQVLVLPPLVIREVLALAAHWAWEHWLLLGYPPVIVNLGDAVLGAAVVLLLLAPPPRRAGYGPARPGAGPAEEGR
ncbi:MAG: YdcF family protein [Bacillota bacterium]